MIELPFRTAVLTSFSSISFDYLYTQGNSCAPKPAMSLHSGTAPDTATNYKCTSCIFRLILYMHNETRCNSDNFIIEKEYHHTSRGER